MKSNLLSVGPRRHLPSILLTISLLALAGCAAIPDLGPEPQPKSIEQFKSEQSLAAPVIGWPGDHWWQRYGDPQLDELVETALRDSPDLARAQARLGMASAMLQASRAPLAPEVTGTAVLTEEKQSYNYLMPRMAVPQGWNDYGRATLNLNWELDFWGKNRAAFKAATSEQQAAEAELAQARLIISTAVTASYAELVHLYSLRDSAEAALAIRTKTVELFRDRYQNGLENLASVRQVEAKQAAADADLRFVDERIALQKNGIAALIGAGPDRGLDIARPTARIEDVVALPENVTLELLGRRPDITAARLRTEAAAKRIDQQKAGFYPSVNLMAFVGYQSLGIDNLTKSGSDMGAVGPAISLPIFNTNRLQGQLRGARAEYDAAVATYNGTLANALREVADAVTSRKALDGELQAAKTAATAAKESHSIISRRYQGGLVTYLDVLVAEDARIAAERAEADVETRALVLNVALVRALGGGYHDGHK